MFKLHLNPTKPQICNFDNTDIHIPEIIKILSYQHGWEGNEFRYEIMKRVKLWRSVSNQPDFDIGENFLRRIEFEPQKLINII